MSVRQPAVVTVVCADPADQPPGLAGRLGPAAEVRPVFDADELRKALAESDVAFVWDFSGTALRDAWNDASRVRWVHVASAGINAVAFPALRERPVVVTNSRGVFDKAIAEFVLGAMLASAKDLPTSLRLQREHVWRHRETRLVAGSSVLVVGAGSIGRAVAGLVRAVGASVVGVARSGRDDPDFDRVVPMAAFGAELEHADFVVVTAPLTDETHGLFDAAAFARMKPGAVLINVGRGPIVDDTALLDALERGPLRGAVLDVFSREPLPADHPFWDRADVLVSPHMCGDFEGFTDVLTDLFVANFARWQAGDALQNVIDLDRGY